MNKRKELSLDEQITIYAEIIVDQLMKELESNEKINDRDNVNDISPIEAEENQLNIPVKAKPWKKILKVKRNIYGNKKIKRPV